jgi:hypothetical protein
MYHADMEDIERAAQRPKTDDLSRPQRERLAHVDFALYFLGELRRVDLSGKFETGPAGATRDIALYREYAPGNCELDKTGKVYRPLPTFRPLFQHSPRRVLTSLSQGFGEGLGDDLEPLISSEIPFPLSVPDASIIAPISRAIHRGLAVRLRYTSVRSGGTEKTIVPIALVDTGIRWHVRAFDREKKEFRDYVLTRMENPVVLEDSPAKKEERAESDSQWSRVINLELLPHPDHPRPELVKMDYGMKEGVLKLKVRAANAGYMLRRWAVDCSPKHELPYIDHPLWLPDPLALYGANNAQLAPGYLTQEELIRAIKAL